MTKEDWDVFNQLLDSIILRFQEYDLEIAKLKFRIKQLEKDEVNA